LLANRESVADKHDLRLRELTSMLDAVASEDEL
jgi:hypothetical protein